MTVRIAEDFFACAAVADLAAGATPPWDTSATWVLNTSGRYAGQQCLAMPASNSITLLKKNNWGSNDATIVVRCAFIHIPVLSGTNIGLGITLADGGTAQCTIVFRSDDAILLLSGGAGGSVLATYTGAFLSNTWTPFEIEVAINNTTGTFTVLKNGNTVVGSPDFQATGLNTRGGTANNQANGCSVVTGAGTTTIGASNQKIGDFVAFSESGSTPNAFWRRSDAGVRQGIIELNSGGTVSDSPANPLLTTYGYGERIDPVDPNTGSAWGGTGIANLLVGPKVA